MQARAAELLSSGLMQSEVARELPMNLRTLQRWCADADFADYVDTLVDEQRAQWNRQFRRIVKRAMQVEEDVMDGKVRADDARAIRAHEILSKTAYRVAALGAVDRSPVRPGYGGKTYLPPGTSQTA